MSYFLYVIHASELDIFHFFSQNVLEITVSDDDMIRDDDCAIVLFDVAKIPLGERVFTAFPLNPEVRTQSNILYSLVSILSPLFKEVYCLFWFLPPGPAWW